MRVKKRRVHFGTFCDSLLVFYICVCHRSLLLEYLVEKYRFSLPSIGQREIDTVYRIIILLSLVYLEVWIITVFLFMSKFLSTFLLYILVTNILHHYYEIREKEEWNWTVVPRPVDRFSRTQARRYFQLYTGP